MEQGLNANVLWDHMNIFQYYMRILEFVDDRCDIIVVIGNNRNDLT